MRTLSGPLNDVSGDALGLKEGTTGLENWKDEVAELMEDYIIQRYRGAENVKLLDTAGLSPTTPITPVGFSVPHYYSVATDRDFVRVLPSL